MMKKYIKYIVPSIITFVILSILFYMNGLYPYGEESIVQVDADYQFIPVLYNIYDFLHGSSNVIYSDMGLGNNIYISMIIQGSLYSPVNLILYFTSRSNIVNYFNVMLMVKLCLISLTSYIYINYKYKKLDYFYQVLGSVLYTFSGFVIFNYFNIMWLDGVILFPLIIMYLDKMIHNEGNLGYIICLSLSLMISYYISYFILLYILFYSFIYFNLYMDKDKIKERVWVLGVNTISAMMISSVSVLPSIYQMLISSRFASDSSFILMSDTMVKSLYILFSPLLVILFVMMISKYKSDRKQIYLYVVLFIMFGIGIVIEPINLMIHGGSYWDFPYRYGFITSFILLNGGLYYIDKYDIGERCGYDLVKLVIYMILMGGMLYISKVYLKGIINERIFLDFYNKEIYREIITIICFMFMIYIVSLCIRNRYMRYTLIALTSGVSIYIICSFTMFYNDGYYLSKSMNEYNESIDIRKDGRYKVDYSSYTPDYGYILKVGELDNWLHIIPSQEIDVYSKLGYLVSGTSVKGYGGTIFSDWLLGIRYIISDKNKDEEIYQLVDNRNGKYLYRYRYGNNYGVLYNGIGIDSDRYRMRFQNDIYHDLMGNDQDIIRVDDYSYQEDDIYIDYDIDELGILYIDIDGWKNIDYIEIGDNYYSEFEDCINEIGVFDQDIRIHIKKNSEGVINFSLGYIRYSDIKNLSSRVRYDDGKYYVSDIDNGEKMIIPVNNVPGIKVMVNDKEGKVDSYLDNFIMVNLDSGDNEIDIKYEMPLFRNGIIISLLGVILVIFNKKIGYFKLGYNVSYYGYMILVWVMIGYYYIYAMIRGIIVR